MSDHRPRSIVAGVVLLLLLTGTARGATYRDIKFGQAVELPAPVNGSGGTGIGFSPYLQDRHPTLTRDGLTLVWQSYLVKNPNWVNDTDNAWYIVQSSRPAWDQPWAAPVDIIASEAGDDPRDDRTPSVSRDGLRLLYNDTTTQGAAGNGREPLKIAARADRSSLFDDAEIVDIVDRRLQGVLGEYGTEIHFDQYRCSFTTSPQQRWPAYLSDGFLGPCGNLVYFFASDPFATPEWEYVPWPPPPWPVPGSFNRYESGATVEGYEFRCEPLDFAPGDLDGQDGWSVSSGVSAVNGSRSALEANQFIEFANGSGDQVAERDTGNTTTGEGAAFTSRFGIAGIDYSSSAVIELGYDDGVTQHVFVRLELNRVVPGEFSALDGDGAGGGTVTQIDLTDVNTGGGGCVPFPVSYEPDRWYMVEVTATVSSSTPSYDVTIRNPFKFGPLTHGSCNFPEQGFVPMGRVTDMGVMDEGSGAGPLNFVRITGEGIRIDAGSTCSAVRNLAMFSFSGLLQVEALDQPEELTTLPLYGEVRSLRIKNYDPQSTPTQMGPARTNSQLSSPYLADDGLVIYYSSSGYWSNGQYYPPEEGCPGGDQCPGDDCCEEDGYYGYPEPVLWRGHRAAVKDHTTPPNQTIPVGDAEPIFCAGVFNLASASRRLLDPHLGPDGLYFTTSDVVGGYDGEMSIRRAPFFGDLDDDGDVDAADQAEFATRMAGAYDAAVDYDLDGDNDADDQAAFDHNLGFQAGDIDGDGDVDYDDFLLMDASCDATICSDDWNQAADLNRDLVIDDNDLALLAQAYGLGVPGGAGSLPELPEALPSCIPCHDPFADLDGDADVDQEDFGVFQACITGPDDIDQVFDPSQCRCADWDGDEDVDQDDQDRFEACASGPAVPAAIDCDDGP